MKKEPKTVKCGMTPSMTRREPMKKPKPVVKPVMKPKPRGR